MEESHFLILKYQLEGQVPNLTPIQDPLGYALGPKGGGCSLHVLPLSHSRAPVSLGRKLPCTFGAWFLWLVAPGLVAAIHEIPIEGMTLETEACIPGSHATVKQ